MANSSGHSKKLTMNAVFFLSYCIGNLIGPQLFQADDAPAYSHGYTGMLACEVVAIVSILGYGLLCFLENRRRDRVYGKGVGEQGEEAFSDLTDMEKKGFRYVY